MSNYEGMFGAGGKSWQYRWISEDGVRVFPRDPDDAKDGICSVDWPTDGLMSVVVGRRLCFVRARENVTGMEAIYGCI